MSELRSLLGRLAAGELSPAEALLARTEPVERLRAELNPFLAVDLDRAMDEARALESLDAETRAGMPLYGLPLTLKDLEPTAGLPTTFGAMHVDSGEARTDGSLAARARAAGCLVYAKTSTPSYGHKDVTDSLVGGVTRNPWDPRLTPGGSSGGAAVVVATGLDPVAHGTDAAGSVRMPAALCGVVGFKPSYGRLPRVPSADLWAARGHHGFLGRSVDDVRVVTAALAGGDPRDPIGPSEPGLGAGIRPRAGRIAVVDSLFGAAVDPGVAALLQRVRDLLSDAGLVVESPATGWEDPVPWVNHYAEAHEFHHFGALHAADPALFPPSQAALIEAGATRTASDLFAYQARRSALHLAATELMDRYDFVLTPTLPRAAWEVDDDRPEVAGTRTPYGPSGRWADVLLCNLTGWPAVSLPCGFVGGLPVGVQVIGPWREDLDCLAFAEEVEALLGPDVLRTPPLFVGEGR